MKSFTDELRNETDRDRIIKRENGMEIVSYIWPRVLMEVLVLLNADRVVLEKQHLRVALHVSLREEKLTAFSANTNI